MLKRLEIKNYAIIDHLELDLADGLSIITGETGAGKSIILGALGLILGNRADSKVLYNKEQKAVVEATFDIKAYGLKSWFDRNEMDYEDELVIRRVISPNGKSRAFVNDEPANLSILKEVAEELIDMHQQFDALDIHKVSYQTNTTDILSQNTELMEAYRKEYAQYNALCRKLSDLEEKQRTAQNEMDFLQFQMDEFNTMELIEGEQAEKEAKLSRLNNAEGIQQACSELSHFVELSESNIIDQLRNHAQSVDRIKEEDPELNSLSERLYTVIEDLSDLSRESTRIAELTEYDGAAIQELSERLDGIYRLQQKHNVNNLTDLLAVQDEIDTKLQSFGDLSADIEKINADLITHQKSLTKQAKAISANRKKAIPKVEKEMHDLLASLSMEHAYLQIKLVDMEQLSPSGLDKAVFYFKANKGSEYQLLKDVASGGEISRLTLCLKSLIADASVLPTLIFDEIDSGVSGNVAGKMGDIIRKLSNSHQVITITHSPQIASKADDHYFVYKEDRADRTVTGLRKLDREGRVQEIAKMLSGNPPSDAAIANAKELLT